VPLCGGVFCGKRGRARGMRLAEGATAAPSVWSWTVTTRDRRELGSAARCAQDAGGWARLGPV